MNAVSRYVSRDAIEELESRMLEMPQAECDVKHSFGPGIYIRELRMRAGTFAVGHYQKTHHVNILMQGAVIILKDDGTTQELRAPLTFIGVPGRKVGRVTEDMVWLNVYATDETSVEKLEALFLDKSDAFLEDARRQIKLLADGDFEQMIIDVGFDAETVRQQSENESDQIPFPMGSYKIKVGASNIHGQGLMAVSDIATGELIAPMRISGKRTPAGRYTNHARTPNAHPVKFGNDDIGLVALRDISGSRGGRDGEEITINYRDAVELTRRLAT